MKANRQQTPHTLCATFKEEEIKKAIFSFNNNKALGLDGFSISFYKKFWHLLKIDLLSACRDFYSKAIINKNVNNTYITHIAKKTYCEKPTDYRPISLTISLYKVIAKILIDRLNDTLPNTIFKIQLAFVKRKTNNICYSYGK